MIPVLPISAMRAFESVARLGGFGRAAEELGVTQSSVSQHVKSLEEWMGRKLLVRGHRKTIPTSDGETLAEAITTGFGQISDVCDALRQNRHTDRKIVVSCLPGFAFNWLFPRLMNFDQTHPDIQVSISTDMDQANFVSGHADIAIRYGIGGYAGLHAEKLLDERIFPVCSPSLLETGPPLKSLPDLSRHTFLLDEFSDTRGTLPTWEFWALQTGQTLPPPARSRRFGQANMVVQAAIQGLGVALGREPLVVDALTSGALVRPFPEVAESRLSYWFVCPRPSLKLEHVCRFRDWIQHEAKIQPAIEL